MKGKIKIERELHGATLKITKNENFQNIIKIDQI